NRNTRHCDIDHTLAWEHGGTTTPENLAHLCRWHHTLKHHGGWTVKQTSPGTLEWTSPHGNLITTQPPPGPHFSNPEADPEPNPKTVETPPPF
ncbi:MAG: HNH endonuclease signature motif containing protein, partial [Terrimesophilobacter sp.]